MTVPRAPLYTGRRGNRLDFARPASSNTFVSALAAGGVGVLLLIGLEAGGFELAASASLALLLSVLLYRGFQAVSGQRGDLLEPINLIALYFLVYFALRALYLLGEEQSNRIGLFFYDDYLPEALLVATLGFLATLAGYRSRIGPGATKIFNPGSTAWPTNVPVAAIVSFLCVGILSSGYLFSRGVVVGNAKEVALTTQTDPLPAIPVLFAMFTNFALAATVTSILSKRALRPKPTQWILLAACLCSIGVIVITNGAKQTMLEPIVESAVILHYLKRKLTLKRVVLWGIPLMFAAFGLLNTYRFVIIGESGGAPHSPSDLLARIEYSLDYFRSDRTEDLGENTFAMLMGRQFGVDSLALTIKFTPERRAFGLGKDLFALPVQALVPRAIWSDKPIWNPSDDFERDYMGVPPGGFSSPHLVADLYQNFHLLGVAFGMFFIGALFRVMYIWLNPLSGDPMGAFTYAVLMPALVHQFECGLAALTIFMLRLILILYVARKALSWQAQRGGAVRSANRPAPRLRRRYV